MEERLCLLVLGKAAGLIRIGILKINADFADFNFDFDAENKWIVG